MKSKNIFDITRSMKEISRTISVENNTKKALSLCQEKKMLVSWPLTSLLSL